MESPILRIIKKMSPDQFVQMAKLYLQVDISPDDALQLVPLIQKNADSLWNESSRMKTIQQIKAQLPTHLLSKVERIIDALQTFQ